MSSKDSDLYIQTTTVEKNQVLFQQYLDSNTVLKNVENIIARDDRLESNRDLLTRGALLANEPELLSSDRYTEEERKSLRREQRHPILSQTPLLFFLAMSASSAAVGFGNDESGVGGAQSLYQEQFGIKNVNVQGTVLAAPYLAGAVSGLLVSQAQKWLGRKHMVFIASILGISGSIWMAASNGLASLLVARLYLGISMVINSIYVPVLISESSPAIARGAFLMLWQTFVAFGVMLGSIYNRAFVGVSDKNLNWRLMIGSSFLAPVVTAILILIPPESPRWLLSKGKVYQSFQSLSKLRSSKIAAARDFYTLFESLRAEGDLFQIDLKDQVKELVCNKRNRFALYVASAAVFGQQYGGVNILVSYTAPILTGAGIDPLSAIAGSIGIGGGCFIATFFSSQLIDRYGRRTMLLLTLPMEAIALFWLGGVLNIADDTSRLGAGLAAMYFFVIFFGLGIGPISWTLVAEVFPLNVRSLGTGYAMSLNWLLDFVLSMTWPKMQKSMTSSGGFYFYGACNVLLWVFTYFMIPETKKYTLEELSDIFGVGALSFSKTKLKQLIPWLRK